MKRLAASITRGLLIYAVSLLAACNAAPAPAASPRRASLSRPRFRILQGPVRSAPVVRCGLQIPAGPRASCVTLPG
jgi:hypothetical protein